MLAFVQLFACFAVPTIYESELNETASDEQLFGWPFINLVRTVAHHQRCFVSIFIFF